LRGRRERACASEGKIECMHKREVVIDGAAGRHKLPGIITTSGPPSPVLPPPGADLSSFFRCESLSVLKAGVADHGLIRITAEPTPSFPRAVQRV